MTSALSPFHLLEINLISAQDISKVSRSMRSYAMAWVHQDRKLTTRVDTNGGNNPTWNDKFVFRVDENFLRSDMSAVMIEIYALNWFRDVHVGTVRVLVSNLIPPLTRSTQPQNLGMRFVALQVRRPSGRPQGILNIGVTVLDSSMRSMPLYTQLDTSALGYQQLMGTEDFHRNNTSTAAAPSAPSARLRRTKSEKSSMLGVDNEPNLSEIPKPTVIKAAPPAAAKPNRGSEIGVGKKSGKNLYDKPLSVVDGASDLAVQLDVLKKTRGKSSSVRGKPRNRGPASSIASQSEIGMFQVSNNNNMNSKKGGSDIGFGARPALPPPPGGKGGVRPPQPHNKGNPISKDFANGSVWSESEVGPSPSEVAAAIAHDNRFRKLEEGNGSILDDQWSSLDDGSEGLRTKLDRWRTQLPSLYDQYEHNSSVTSTAFAPKHARRHTEPGGKFSCFGNIAGFECTIVCGRSAPKRRAGQGDKRLARSPSLDSMSTYL